MSLTAAEIAYVHSELGTVDRADLNERYVRLNDVRAIIREILKERRAALIADPLSVTVQGIATVNNSENVRALERQIANLEHGTDDDVTAVIPTPMTRRSRTR